ncbi:MAG: spermidine synthase, partial [Myxococcota bacterium]|nr:spermidine synthase [Myxococcota bacterium]
MAPARTSQTAALTLIFFLSGASGLVFEIVWFRGLALTFGSATPAIATVVAAFMAGLALGNLALGPMADRSPAPLRLYQRLEVGIGLTGLLVSLLLVKGEVVLAPLTRIVAGAGAVGGPLRFILVFGLMTVPTALMGGTLPVMARALHRSGAAGRVLGWLYAVNTGGAVIGALLPDLLTVPRIGLAATALVAALGNLLAALAVRAVAVDAPPVRSLPRRALSRPALALYAASGFCALGYQIVWGRLLAMWSLSWVVSYSVLLAVFLACLAVGSHLGSRVADRVRDPLVWAALLLVAT